MNSLRAVRGRNESAWLLPLAGPDVADRMRHYSDDDEVDLVIVGCGAGGSTVAQRLSRAGWSVVMLEAWPFWEPDRDWVSDEAGSHKLYWTEPRVIDGDDPIPLGSNNSGRGVGGSMVHFAGYTPRFHPSDFRTETLDGWAPTGLWGTKTSVRTTKTSRRSCPSRDRTGLGATPTATRTDRTPWAATARCSSVERVR